MSTDGLSTKEVLARCYYLLAQQKLDDRTYTHLSARVPGEEAYYIYPLGLFFAEVTPEKLIKVDFDGRILEGAEQVFNTTGYVIHSSVYQARSDVNAVFHIHSVAGVAVSCMKQGLLPLSQFALHFYRRIAYHAYDALNLDKVVQGERLVHDLGPYQAMLLQNHGTMTCGQTLEEALFYLLFLEEACRVQVAALSAGESAVNLIDDAVAEQAYHAMTAFEQGAVGVRDFKAMCRLTHFPWHTNH